MHPNEIKINSSNILELYDLSVQLGSDHNAALQEQIIRQEAASKEHDEALSKQLERLSIK